MMKAGKILRRLARREMKKNRLQFASMIAITMLAVTLFCGFLSNTKTLKKAVDSYFASTDLCDLCVQMQNVTEEDKEYFSALGEKTEYRIYAEGTFGEKSSKIYVGDTSVSHPVLLKGEAGVLIDEKTAQLNGIAIGAEVMLAVSVPVGSSSYQVSLPAQVTGFMNFPETAVSSTAMAVYITEAKFEELAKKEFPFMKIQASDFYNQALIKTDSPAAVKERISEHFSGNDNLLFIYDRNSMETPVMLDGEVSQSRKMLYVFPVIFLLVSVFVILTTVNRLILEERTEIGTLKGLGFSRGEILRHYASFGGILCLIGGLAGAAIGPFIVPNVMKVKYQLVYSLPFPALPSFDILGSLLSVGLVALLAALISVLVCRGVVRESPAECMRPVVPKDNFFLKLSKRRDKGRARPSPEVPDRAEASNPERRKKGGKDHVLSLKMAARNIAIKPVRALMTIIGITGCVALLMCAFGIGDTVDNSLRTELYKQFTYDISTPYSSENFEKEMQKLADDGEIEAFETYTIHYMTASTDEAGKDIKVYNFGENMKMTTIDTGGGKVVVSRSIAEFLNLKKGGKFRLVFGSQTFEFTADEIVDSAITKGGFLHTDQFGEVYGTPSAWIKAEKVTDGLLDKINAVSGTAQASSVAQLWDYVEEKVASINAMKYTLMIFAILLSVVVLYNLSLLNINERTRDIATLKVLGFTRGKIARSLLYEIMLLTLIGTAFGLALGYPVTYLVLSINKVEIMSFLYYLKPVSYVYSALLALLTSFAINLAFGKSIGRINMIESLKSVE